MSDTTKRHWKTVFRTVRPVPGFLRLKVVGSESAFDASYRIEGRNRTAVTHCGFQYTLSGEGIFEDAKGQYRVGPEMGFLCKVGDPTISYYFPEDAREDWRFMWISMDGETADVMTRSLVERYGRLYSLEWQNKVIQRFLAYRHAKPEEDISTAQGAEIVTSLFAALADAGEYGNETTQKLTREVKELVQSRLHENINVKKLAGMLGVSREYLSRSFKRETGETLHDYILQRKALYACRLLKETALSHADIAARLGYGSSAHFARMFKSILHMTPRRFRTVGTMPDF